ncbi:hypothetical protein [Rhodopirellula sp. MGV]|uniref:hypothetical protein n=1 Tax=Rhodopirellula sp. MGV TaxID=2023130 RepID=UPI000B97351F|nr:hypothetical protein [Rhodopirellula sp. MGV]PNY38643.1 hypothetical protein C2E31_01625 [Rhodopirellula baltica]
MTDDTILPSGEIHLAGPPSRHRGRRRSKKPTSLIGFLTFGLVRFIIKGMFWNAATFGGAIAVAAIIYFFKSQILLWAFGIEVGDVGAIVGDLSIRDWASRTLREAIHRGRGG